MFALDSALRIQNSSLSICTFSCTTKQPKRLKKKKDWTLQLRLWRQSFRFLRGVAFAVTGLPHLISLLPGTAFLLPVPATTSCVSIKSMWTVPPWDLSSSAWHPVPVLISREMEIVCVGRGVGGWVELVHVVMEAGNLKHLQSEIIDWKLWNCWRYSLIWRKTGVILLLPGTLVFFFKPGKVRATHKYDG